MVSSDPARQNSTRSRWSDLRLRLISGLLLGLVAGGALFIGGWAAAALVIVAATAMAIEFRSIIKSAPTEPEPARLGLSDAFFPACAAAAPFVAHLQGSYMNALIVLGGGMALTLLLDRRGGLWRWSAPGLVLIGGSTAAFVSLRDLPIFGLETALWLVLVVAASDAGGYFAGRMIGGWRLAPKLSPNKTWSGLAGGLALAFAVGALFSWLTTGTYAEEVCAVSLVAALLAQGGDLAESALKRRFGRRDSGRMLPGHGGALDRLDGLMMATLVATMVTYARGREVFIW